MNNSSIAINTQNIDKGLSDLLKQLEKKEKKGYKKFIEKIKHIEIMSYEEFKNFCSQEYAQNFLGSEDILEKEIIRECIIKPISSKDKYLYLKFLWGFIKDEDLNNEIIELLKKYVPSDSEALELNGILNPGDNFGYTVIVENIITGNYIKEEEEEEEEGDFGYAGRVEDIIYIEEDDL